MKKIISLILFCFLCASGFCENPRWKEFGTPIPAHADLDVRWEAPNKFIGSNVPTNKWPSKIWIYQFEPRKFSPKVISNLMRLCSFTEKDIVQQDTNGITFKNQSRTLSISFSSGNINYDTPEPNYILKPDIFKEVPKPKQIPNLVKNFLKKIDISFSEIQRDTNGAPLFYFTDRGYEYMFNQTLETNTWASGVVFRRAINGAEVIGDAGYCALQFGEHGSISKIEFSWPELKPYKSVPILKLPTIIDLVRQGKAHQGLLPMGFASIDWRTVKSVTIKQAWPCYFGGNSLLYPFLDFWTTVETQQGYVDVEIDCPLIDETK